MTPLRSAPFSKVLFLDHQFPPQCSQLERGPEKASDIEKLGLPVGSMKVVDRNFLEAVAQILEFLDHFKTDRSRGGSQVHMIEYLSCGSQVHMIEYLSSQEPVVAVHVAKLEPEKDTHNVMIEFADENSVQRV